MIAWLLISQCDWLDPHRSGSRIRNHPFDETNYKTCKTVRKAFTYNQQHWKHWEKCFQTWPGQADKSFQGRTKIFNTIAEKFYPRIKIFGGQFFLDRTNQPQSVNILFEASWDMIELFEVAWLYRVVWEAPQFCHSI